jgi:hypothetical protein
MYLYIVSNTWAFVFQILLLLLSSSSSYQLPQDNMAALYFNTCRKFFLCIILRCNSMFHTDADYTVKPILPIIRFQHCIYIPQHWKFLPAYLVMSGEINNKQNISSFNNKTESDLERTLFHSERWWRLLVSPPNSFCVLFEPSQDMVICSQSLSSVPSK